MKRRREPTEYRPGRPFTSIGAILYGEDQSLKKALADAIKNLPTDGNLEFSLPVLTELQETDDEKPSGL